ESISSKSSLVIKLAMDAIYSSRDNDLQEDYLALLRIINFKSKDLKEGASAFLEKRKPQWKGE
ncbi:MAG: enoyl-CoA hydratase, partial [Deferribacterota bacterium]|nr:enoyl-CoA hydratase [Deferribacterota bacterium]